MCDINSLLLPTPLPSSLPPPVFPHFAGSAMPSSFRPVIHVHIAAPAGTDAAAHASTATITPDHPAFAHLVSSFASAATRSCSIDSADAVAACRSPSWGSRASSSEPEDAPKRPPGAPKSKAKKTIAKPHTWSPDDHAKFVAGLKKFGLEESLGADGAELMSLYMGNRTRLQIRSHAQKYYAHARALRSS